jgi:hypothetical protein
MTLQISALDAARAEAGHCGAMRGIQDLAGWRGAVMSIWAGAVLGAVVIAIVVVSIRRRRRSDRTTLELGK